MVGDRRSMKHALNRYPTNRSRDPLAAKLAPAVVEIAKQDRKALLEGLHPVARFAAAPFLSAILAALAPILTRIATELFASLMRRIGERTGNVSVDTVAPLSTDVHAYLAAHPEFLDEVLS